MLLFSYNLFISNKRILIIRTFLDNFLCSRKGVILPVFNISSSVNPLSDFHSLNKCSLLSKWLKSLGKSWIFLHSTNLLADNCHNSSGDGDALFFILSNNSMSVFSILSNNSCLALFIVEVFFCMPPNGRWFGLLGS